MHGSPAAPLPASPWRNLPGQLAWETVRLPRRRGATCLGNCALPRRRGATCLGNCALPRRRGATCLGSCALPPPPGRNLPGKLCASSAAGAQLAWETVRLPRSRGATCLGNSAIPPTMTIKPFPGAEDFAPGTFGRWGERQPGRAWPLRQPLALAQTTSATSLPNFRPAILSA